MEHVVHSPRGLFHALVVAHVTHIKPRSRIAKPAAEVVLFGLIAGEDAQLADTILGQQPLGNCGSKRPSATGNEDAGLVATHEARVY